jgi:hypothetical protein
MLQTTQQPHLCRILILTLSVPCSSCSICQKCHAIFAKIASIMGEKKKKEFYSSQILLTPEKIPVTSLDN